jgi:cobalt-zinc-cadmium efflux system outer membrane protein
MFVWYSASHLRAGARRLAVVGCLLAVAGVPTGSLAQESPSLTAEQAVRQAMDREAFETAQASRVREARGEQTEAGAWPNPELAIEREAAFEEGGAVAEDFFILEQALPVWGERRLREEAAAREVEAAEASNEAQRLERRLEVERIFYETLRAQKRLESAREWRERVGRAAETMQRRQEADEASEYAIQRMRHAEDEAKVAVEAARAAVIEQSGELAALVGRPDGKANRWELVGQLRPEALPELSALTDELDQQPELKALEARRRGASKRREAAQRAVYPMPSVMGGYKRLDAPTGGSFHGFLVGVSLSLPIFSQQLGARRAARSQEMRLDAERRLMARRKAAKVASLHQSASIRMEAAREYRQEAVGRAQKILDRVQSRQEAGEASLFELVDAYRTLHDSREEVIDRAWEARETRLELRRVAGGFP